jgi:hypothetical protein
MRMIASNAQRNPGILDHGSEYTLRKGASLMSCDNHQRAMNA